jgi:hypothetical protein
MRFRYIIQAGQRRGWLPSGRGDKLHSIVKDLLASGIPAEQINISIKAIPFTVDADFEVLPAEGLVDHMPAEQCKALVPVIQ